MNAPIPKTVPYRNRRLLDLAHSINECQVQIPGVCQRFSPEGCEPAHPNWSEFGKGMSRKADDCYFAASCHACHAAIDQGSTLTKEQRWDFWWRGFTRTVRLLWLRGLIKVT